MKRSSSFTLAVVVILFVLIQGWVMKEKFFGAKHVESTEAMLMGEDIAVGSPVAGFIADVSAAHGQRVRLGQKLFTVVPQSPLEPYGGEPHTVFALRDGIFAHESLTVGTFVQASQIVGHVLNNNPDSLHVLATIPIKPQLLSSITPLLTATVRSDLLNDGMPLRAIVTTVGSQYDWKKRAITVRLRLLDDPSQLPSPASGLPVTVSIALRPRACPLSFFANILCAPASILHAQKQ